MRQPDGRPRGFGYVTLDSPQAAELCLAQPQVIDGRVVDMKRAVPEGDMDSAPTTRPLRAPERCCCATPRLPIMSALLDALRWPNFIAEEDSAQMGAEGKSGIPRFNGEPTRLAEYVFRVKAKQLKEQALSDEERKKHGPLALRLVEGLSGTALRVAQTLDFKELSKPEAGVEKLLAAFEKELKPRRAQQARELYAAGSAPNGMLRRTWYRCLLDASDDMKLPDVVLAEQLLASANISADHQLLVRTALQGDISFDRVADELIAQHSRLHEREKSRSFVPRKPFYGHHQHGQHRKGSGKWHGAFYADENAEQDQANYQDAPDETYDPEEPYVSDDVDPIEEHIGFMVDDGVDLDDPDCAEAAAEVLQAEQEAYFVKKGAAQKGKGFRGPPSAPRHFAVSGSLSLEERKAKIASLKSRTTCRRCGAVGHWSGDSQCPATKGGGRKGKGRPGSNAPSSPSSTTASKGSPQKQRTVYFAIHEHGAASSTGYMALRGDGFHAVPPPSSLDRPAESHGRAPQDALVPAHESLVPVETRPQWVDLSPQRDGASGAEMIGLEHELPSLFSRPLTNDEKEELMLQQALGRLSQPSLPMEVDGPGLSDDQFALLPAGVPPLPVRAEQPAAEPPVPVPRQHVPVPPQALLHSLKSRSALAFQLSTDSELTADEAAGAVRSFQSAVDLKLSQLGPGDTIGSRTLIEALALSLRLAEVWHDGSNAQSSNAAPSEPHTPPLRTPLLAPARSDPTTHQGTRRVLRERAVLQVGAGKYKNNPCYQAYEDVNYKKWVLETIDEKSSREMRSLKNLMLEIGEYEAIHGKLFTVAERSMHHAATPSSTASTRTGYMAVSEHMIAGSENDLIAVLDTGCNIPRVMEHIGWLDTSRPLISQSLSFCLTELADSRALVASQPPLAQGLWTYAWNSQMAHWPRAVSTASSSKTLTPSAFS
eukprot:s182_g54.t1